MGLYEVPLSVSLLVLCFVKSSFKHTREECESKRAYVILLLLLLLLFMCFRCPIFNSSGPCELLFLLCFIASWN